MFEEFFTLPPKLSLCLKTSNKTLVFDKEKHDWLISAPKFKNSEIQMTIYDLAKKIYVRLKIYIKV